MTCALAGWCPASSPCRCSGRRSRWTCSWSRGRWSGRCGRLGHCERDGRVTFEVGGEYFTFFGKGQRWVIAKNKRNLITHSDY